ncbi:MAG TPA: M3 family oligoendopeptidase [Candidatus Paceibacterota bacterium]|nr:M3 family oligoendopeptidase [Candidatus Paceibacterota bacterium]
MPKTTKTTWDLSPLFKGLDDPEIPRHRARCQKATAAFAAKWKDRKDYLEEPAVLKEALDDWEQWTRNYGAATREGYYLGLLEEVEAGNSAVKGAVAKHADFANAIRDQIRFFWHSLSRIPKEKQMIFLDHELLTPYRHYLERLFAEASHILSEPEEKILNLKQPLAYSRWMNMISGMLAKSERKVYDESGKASVENFSRISKLIHHHLPKVRDKAAEALNDILRQTAEAAEAEINAIVTNQKIDDQLRGFSRPDQQRLMDDDVEMETIDTLRRAVVERFDIPKRYYQLKAKLFKVPKLRYHERNLSYGKADSEFPYADSLKLVGAVFSKLDPEFKQILDQFTASRQFDAFPRKGKRGGAFCACDSVSLPTYILLNHTNRLGDVETIAHEMGHGIHNEMMRKKQNALNFGVSKATAEVASTFMEDFVFEELVKEAGEETRLALMLEKLAGDISSLFRQIALYEFELELHAKIRESGHLSHEEIGKLFRKHMKAYMGPAVEQSPGSENWWIYWIHIRYMFYVYSYASGLLISKALQRKVRANPEDIQKVKAFMAAGVSQSPKDIFAELGIDINDKKFWEEGLAEIDGLLKETAALAKKLKKI